MSELIDYLDRDRLRISFTTMIIRVSSVNKYYGQLSAFVKETELYGVTNGKILLMAETMDPPYGLYDLADRYLIPIGLEEDKDYVIVAEQHLNDPLTLEAHLINRPIPALKKIFWLDSLITRGGNYVWHKKPEQEKNAISVKNIQDSDF